MPVGFVTEVPLDCLSAALLGCLSSVRLDRLSAVPSAVMPLPRLTPARLCCSEAAVDSPPAGAMAVTRRGRCDAERSCGRAAGSLATVGAFLAVTLTFCTGRFRNSETSATITGVAAALTRVPGPHNLETANDAVADATAAISSV